MNLKRAILRAAADRDVQETIDFYLGEGAQDAALKFIDALEQTLRRVEQHPAAGSTRYMHELGLPGLRYAQLKGYPHLVFYVERNDHLDVWRVLHGSRDIPLWLRPPE